MTFSDGTASFPANTYIVSITDATHIVVSNNAKKDNAAAAVTIFFPLFNVGPGLPYGREDLP